MLSGIHEKFQAAPVIAPYGRTDLFHMPDKHVN
jgi:hypothetical protein